MVSKDLNYLSSPNPAPAPISCTLSPPSSSFTDSLKSTSQCSPATPTSPFCCPYPVSPLSSAPIGPKLWAGFGHPCTPGGGASQFFYSFAQTMLSMIGVGSLMSLPDTTQGTDDLNNVKQNMNSMLQSNMLKFATLQEGIDDAFMCVIKESNEDVKAMANITTEVIKEMGKKNLIINAAISVTVLMILIFLIYNF
jgi:hypothetical protein